MTDFEEVVQKMFEFLLTEEREYSRGEMMSMAESKHGEIMARQHREYLEHLIRTCQIGET